MAPSADQILATAASQIGGYFPGASPYGTWYGQRVGAPGTYATAAFCAMGVSWCAAQHDGGLDAIPLHAYTPSGASWFQARSQWGSRLNGAQRGDLVYFDFGLGRISHVGLIEQVNADGTVNTIEFNTSSTAAGSQRNGRTVARKRRGSTYVVGYGRPAYTATSTTARALTNPTKEDDDMARLIAREGDNGIFISDPARGIHSRITDATFLDLAKSLYGETQVLRAGDFDVIRQIARDVNENPVRD